MDEDLRNLERLVEAGDTTAMLRLYHAKRRSGDVVGAAVLGFQRAILLNLAPASLIDLLARLRFAPAIAVMKEQKKRIQNEITSKLLNELGQVTTVKLTSLVLSYGLQDILTQLNHPIPDGLVADLQKALDQLWQWQPGQKLDLKIRKDLQQWMHQIEEQYALKFNRDFGPPEYADSRRRDVLQAGINDVLQLASILEGCYMAYGGRLTNRTAIGYAREAKTIIDKLFYNYDWESGGRRISALSVALEVEFPRLGAAIGSELIDALLITKDELIQRVPTLKKESADYYKQEITGRRFTVVSLPKPYLTVNFPEIGDKPYEFTDVIIWTPDEEEARKRAGVIAAHFGIKIGKQRLSTHHYLSNAKELLAMGLEENRVTQEGFRPRATKRLIKEAEAILLCRAIFRGGKPEYLPEGIDTSEGDRALSSMQRTQATRDARNFVKELKQVQASIIEPIRTHDVSSMAINISHAIGISFRLQVKNYDRRVLEALAQKYHGEFRAHIDRGSFEI